jgi:hypothetical protein
MPGNLALLTQQTESSPASHRSQLHTQANVFPFLSECDKNWTKVSYKQSRSPNNDIVTKTRYSKESEYWPKQTVTFNRFAFLQEEGRKGQKQTNKLRGP